MLYRGKRLNGTWTVGQLLKIHVTTGTDKTYLLDRNSTAYDIHNNLSAVLYEVQPDTLGKATGKTDRNGRKIFEGDILELHYHSYSEPAEVKFGEYQPESEYEPDTHLGFYAESENEINGTIQQELPAVLGICTVIGNIHEELVHDFKSTVVKDGEMPF